MPLTLLIGVAMAPTLTMVVMYTVSDDALLTMDDSGDGDDIAGQSR